MPALHLDPTQVFCGDKISLAPKPKVGTCGIMNLMQLEHGHFSNGKDKNKHPTIATMVREGEVPDQTAEEYLVQTLGIPHDDDFGHITSVEGKAPTKTNVYTDGSVLYPNHRYAQIGTYAAYHKTGRSTLQILTANETWASYECEFEPASIKLYGPLNGAFASPNRAEAAVTLLVFLQTNPTASWIWQLTCSFNPEQDHQRHQNVQRQTMGIHTARRHMEDGGAGYSATGARDHTDHQS